MDHTQYRHLCEAALEAATSAGADYAEVRLVSRRREMNDYRNGSIELSNDTRDVGVGIRAFVNGRWGYGGTNLLHSQSVVDASMAAVEGARVSGGPGADVTPFEIPAAVRAQYETPMGRDPFEVSSREKANLMSEAHNVMLSKEGVKMARGGFVAHRQETTFLASNGSDAHQRITLSGGGISAIASANGDVQVRSYPKSFEGNVLQGGFDLVEGMDLVGHAGRIAEEAVALTGAEPTPSAVKTIILDGSQLYLQIHESVGHPTELDRVLGGEISLAGGSFLRPESRDAFRYGSEHVSLTADSTTPLGPGTYAFDDEGTPATRSPIIDRGQFVGFLCGRESAGRIGCKGAAASRSESWSRPPIDRMVNVNLEPGQGSTEALISGVEDGLLLAANKSWSIDDLRLNFQFSCEIAYEIKAGKLTGKIFKNPIYYGVSPQFWASCSGIAGPEDWQMWGVLYCGKGDPGQLMYVGHGCAPARFDNVQVGST